MIVLIPLILVAAFPKTTHSQNLVSPCPNLFTYEPQGVNGDRWFGNIQVTLDTELSGIWMRTVFDRPLLELGTDFGEAVQREPNEFLIKRPSPKVNAGETLRIRIFARFDPAQGTPSLLGFRLNGKTVCPENGVIESTTPGLVDTFVSPCPNLFAYEPLGPGANVWHGNIRVTSDAELSGVWMRVILDKLPVKFESNFGEVKQREASDFLIRNPGYKVKTAEPLQIRISVEFNPGEPPPKLLGFRLNARTVCPENGVIEVPTVKPQLVSPCPNLFTYDTNTQEKDKWFGNINIKSDLDLAGIWLRVLFDKPISEIKTDFGEAVMRGPNDFLIRNPQHSIKVGEVLQLRISVPFTAGESPPQLSEIRLNARTVCPTSGPVETTTQPVVEQLISPCPNTFLYEPPGAERDKWFGNMNLVSDVDLTGVWIRVILDNPSIQLGNWFGEVKTEEQALYVIRNPGYRLRAGETLQLRFFIKFRLGQPVPKLKEIKLNGVTVCPTNTDTGFFNRPVTDASGGQGIEWITFPPVKSESDRPIFGPDFKPNSKPNFAQSGSSSSQQCGTVATHPVPLISHGTATEEGMWPWHAALYFPNGAYLEYYCGGSLISLRHVLTVAHCVARKYTTVPLPTDDIQVFLGKYQLSKSTRGVQYKQVKKIDIHPLYDTSYYANDIGLIHLTSPIEYSDWVRPVCLWSENTDLSSVENRQGTVVGWGYDNTGRVSDRLLKAIMPVVSHRKCIWSKKDFYSKTVNDKNFCAGFRNGTSVCTGDSGGGLVFPKATSNPRNPVWHIRGLVSISVALQDNTSLCDTSHYVIFTDAAKYLAWIRQTSGSN